MIEPGMVLETDGIVPLRFVVIETDIPEREDGDTYLYCTARNGMIPVNLEEFIEVENATVQKMTTQVIREEINHRSAEVAEIAHTSYIEGTSTGEIL